MFIPVKTGEWALVKSNIYQPSQQTRTLAANLAFDLWSPNLKNMSQEQLSGETIRTFFIAPGALCFRSLEAPWGTDCRPDF